MTRIWIAAAIAASLTLAGCGGSGSVAAETGGKAEGAQSKSRAIQGTFLFESTAEVEAQLAQNAGALEELKKAAAAGDLAAKETLAGLGKNPAGEKRLLSGMKLQIRSDGSFIMDLPDVGGGKPKEAGGTYALDPTGIKLTLTITSIDGAVAEGADAKAFVFIFDDNAKTLTGDTGVGPKLVMRKR